MPRCHAVVLISIGANGDPKHREYGLECRGECDEGVQCKKGTETKYYLKGKEVDDADAADQEVSYSWCACDEDEDGKPPRPSRCHTELKSVREKDHGKWKAEVTESIVCAPRDHACGAGKVCRPKLIAQEVIALPHGKDDDDNEFLVGDEKKTYTLETWMCACVPRGK